MKNQLVESVDSINKQLADKFGIETTTGRPMWRVVWVNDQREIRFQEWEDYSPEGIYLRTVTEAREVPKYEPEYQDRYVLEHLVVVPITDERTLPTAKLSYEPIWYFETQYGDYLPPRFDVSVIVIDSVNAAMGKQSMARYVDPRNKVDGAEYNRQRIDTLVKDMFGEEKEQTTLPGERVVVPNNYGDKNVH